MRLRWLLFMVSSVDYISRWFLGVWVGCGLYVSLVELSVYFRLLGVDLVTLVVLFIHCIYGFVVLV